MEKQYGKPLATMHLGVKEYPRGKFSYAIKMGGFRLLGMLLFFAVEALLSILLNDFNFFLVTNVFNFTIVIFTLGAFFSGIAETAVQVNLIRRIETKRRAAIQGDRRLLADTQPQAGISRIPIIFHYRRNGKMNLLGFFLLLIPYLLILLIIFLAPRFLVLHLFQEMMLIISLILASLPIFLAMINGKDARLVADETGLALFAGKERQNYIPWQDARLFTIADPSSKKMLAQPNVFELASKDEILQWRGRSELAWDESEGISIALTAEQYQWLLQELHALIIYKTGLPLFDLRR